jgi:predicted nucleotidyltransferase
MPASDPSLLTRGDIEQLLDRLASAAERDGIKIDLFLVGGGAMALAYNTARVTRDLDAVFEPKQKVYELARQVAADSGLDLGDTWLNDGVKGFLPGDDPEAAVLRDSAGLTVRVASPRYLFVLKAMAARETDEDDLRLLYPLCGFRDAADALDVIERSYPKQPIRPIVQYLVAGIAAGHAD